MHNFEISITGHLENTDSLSYAKFPNVQWKISRYTCERIRGKRQVTSEYYDKNRYDHVDPPKRSWGSQGSVNQTLKITALCYLST